MKKKHVALLLSAAMVLSLTACGGGSDAPATDEAPAESSGDETAAPEESDASETEETDSAAAPANDTLVASVEQGLEGKFSPYFALAANDVMIDEMVRVYTLEVDRVGNPILNGIEGETRSYNGTDYTYYTASNIEITENEDGTTQETQVQGVYCLVGREARFKPVEVVWQEEDYMLVRPAEGTGESRRLRSGDTVIIAAVDLYDGKVING